MDFEKQTILDLAKDVKDFQDLFLNEMMKNAEIVGPSKWAWWRVKNGVWENPKLDWLTGTYEEMAVEHGVHSEEPVISRTKGNVEIMVYGLKERYVPQASIEEVDKHNQLMTYPPTDEDEEAAEKLFDSWDGDGPTQWFYFWGKVHPSSHLVFACYNSDVETHAIFCETYKDMLDVVNLILGAA